MSSVNKFKKPLLLQGFSYDPTDLITKYTSCKVDLAVIPSCTKWYGT